MKPDSIAFALAGMVFGLLAGWVIGAQYATTRAVPLASVAPAAPATVQQAQPPAPPPLNESDVEKYRKLAEAEPTSVAPRVALANLYFDAERYSDAVKWYEDGRQTLKYFTRGADRTTRPRCTSACCSTRAAAWARTSSSPAPRPSSSSTRCSDAEDMTLVDFDTEVRVAKYGQQDFPRMVERIRSRKPDG